MKHYRTVDGETLIVETDHELIIKLRASSRDPEPTKHLFMVAMATRVQQQIGINLIPTDTEAGFVLGLIESGMITEVQE